MSALAKLCINLGVYVTGSDISKTDITEELSHIGIKIFYGHKRENIKGADLVVYTCACGLDNVELLQAKNDNIEIIERADFLANIASCYKEVIAVSGSHGKTTTTAMIGNIFLKAKLNPTVHLGGECENFNGNLKIGEKNFFITEACEYQKHLLKLPHSVGVILNIEMDHAECYEDFNDLYKTFDKFADSSKKIVIINEKFKHLSTKKVISFGNNGNFSANNIRIDKNGYIKFNCYKNSQYYGSFKLKGYGYFNVQNALASIAVADYYKIDYEYIYEGLATFNGIKRRYEYMGKVNNQVVIHDYAHHPTQIENIILTTKKLFNKPITVIFQPHTYSRTKYLFGGFVDKLSLADSLVILPTYPARETKKDGYDAKKLFLTIKKLKKNTKYCYSYNRVLRILDNKKDNVILILGAGDIVNLAKKIKKDYLAKK